MNLCFVLLSVCLGLGLPTSQDEERLSPEAAIAAVGKAEILVEFTVKASKDRLERRGCIFLDSEANFEDPKNLGIALSAKVAAQLKEKGIANPAEFFLGKKLAVRGAVMRFEERPYIPVLDISQLSFADTNQPELKRK